MSKNLTAKVCVACEGGTPPFTDVQIAEYMQEVSGWSVSAETPKKIRKEFKFKNFVEAMRFVNGVARIAEQEQHHPDLHIFYNKVNIKLWTHAVNGLSENDFILAAKIDQLSK